ncbi:MAG: hypothetical protein ACI30J_09130 [Paludibacteraceae bacterium]
MLLSTLTNLQKYIIAASIMILVLLTSMLVIAYLRKKRRMKVIQKLTISLEDIGKLVATEQLADARRELDNIRTQIMLLKDEELLHKLEHISNELRHNEMIAQAFSSLYHIQTLVARKKLTSARKELEGLQHRISSLSNDTLRQKYDYTLQSLQKEELKVQEEVQQKVTETEKIVQEGTFNDIEQVKSSIKKLVSSDFPKRFAEPVNSCITRIESLYAEGINPEHSINNVSYDTSNVQTANRDGYYCTTSFPKIGTVLFPYRRKKVERRGYMEERFQSQLSASIRSFENFMVLGDVSIVYQSSAHPYEPDIAIVEKDFNKGVRIDIEIDEPYSGYDKKPIHYLDCGDDFRDKMLTNLGWIVIRFSEKQVYKEPKKCIDYIAYIISILVNSKNKLPLIFPEYDKKWSELEANMMILRRERETLLKHEFGKLESPSLNKKDIVLTALEKEATQEVTPIYFPQQQPINLDDSLDKYKQDDYLTFNPKEHIYLYKGVKQFMPVSSVVSKFFRYFDAIEESERYARRRGLNQLDVLFDWYWKRQEACEVGTFLHAQIERYFNRETPLTQMQFVYNQNPPEKISIEKELLHFYSFLQAFSITPYRTEWHIYDKTNEIAGTIDLLCRSGNNYEIYDWIRSKKVSPNEPIYQYGINGLESIPDTSYFHYVLRQNLYKYILEHNYGLSISKMHLVVLHSQNSSFIEYEVPTMEEATQTIIRNLRNL